MSKVRVLLTKHGSAATGVALAVLLASASLALSSAADREPGSPPPVLRLHIIANSDSSEDQTLKLRVRNRVISQIKDSFGQTIDQPMDPDLARAALRGRLSALKEAAEDEMALAGFAYPVRAEMGWFEFGERVYGGRVFPAGQYEAVRLVIGQGAGANWWSVLFPPLGFVDSAGGLATASEPRLQLNQNGKPDNNTRIEIRWAWLDWAQGTFLRPVTYR